MVTIVTTFFIRSLAVDIVDPAIRHENGKQVARWNVDPSYEMSSGYQLPGSSGGVHAPHPAAITSNRTTVYTTQSHPSSRHHPNGKCLTYGYVMHTCSWKFGTCPGGRPRYQSKRCLIFSGSLPPSPADSGVSDVDPSSSSHNSDDENRLHRHRHAMQGRLKACTVSKNVDF